MSSTERAIDHVTAVAPAVAFLVTGVVLAALLERLGFFDALVDAIARRHGRITVRSLWWLAAATTAVLNLDTTIVLLTPLYVRLVRHSEGEVDVLAVAAVPLLLAAFASSVLPVSNLTSLIATDQLSVPTTAVLAHLGGSSLAACLAGWAVHRRRVPATLTLVVDRGDPDRRALRVGGVITAGVLLGFVLGPAVGIRAWMVALAADAVLVVVTRWVPWREVPLAVATFVLVLAGLVGLAVPTDWFVGVVGPSVSSPVPGVVVGTGVANVVNNLPAVLVAVASAGDRITPGMWGWLLGANVGAVLLPVGALANLLWWRIARDEGVQPRLGAYLRHTLPAGAAALAAATATLTVLLHLWP